MSSVERGGKNVLVSPQSEIPCKGNVALKCPTGFHKDSRYPNNGWLWDKVKSSLTDHSFHKEENKIILQNLIETLP